MQIKVDLLRVLKFAKQVPRTTENEREPPSRKMQSPVVHTNVKSRHVTQNRPTIAIVVTWRADVRSNVLEGWFSTSDLRHLHFLNQV